jgi:hypothetical protein
VRTEEEELRDGIRAAMQYMKERKMRYEAAAEQIGEDEQAGQHRLGLADGYGESIGILEEMTGVSAVGLGVPAPRESESGGAWVSDLAKEFLKELEEFERR